MSMIDWSDPEEMLGLLAEFIRDELQNEHADEERRMFLRALSAEVNSLASDASVATLLASLRNISEEQRVEFRDDPVMAHVRDCIEELQRLT